MVGEPIGPPLINSTTSQYKHYFAYRSSSPLDPYRDKTIGNRVVRSEPLPGSVEQVHAPGVGVAMPFGREQIAVGRLRIDAGEHRRHTLEDFVVQAHADTREVLITVDRPSLLRGPLLQVVHAAHADGHTQQIAHELHHPAIRTAANQR